MRFRAPKSLRNQHSGAQSARESIAKDRAHYLGYTKSWHLLAWTSQQSHVIANRNVLDEEYQKLSEKYPDEDVPRPLNWGGYSLKPSSIEFWQGRPSRLHDRILYTKENNAWKIERLAP
jgi:pyridoxamine 5'-phosphate oxidase